jgi:hypothetical protein
LPTVTLVTVNGDEAPACERVTPPLLDAQDAVYAVIALPLSPGAANVTTSTWFARLTVGWAGTSGTAAGTTAFDAGDVPPLPTSFVAVTVHVYVLPLVRLLTVIGDAGPVLLPGTPPSLDVHDTEYDMIALPLSAGGVNETTTTWSPRAAEGAAGVPGRVAGTTGFEADDGGLTPTAFVAVTVHV